MTQGARGPRWYVWLMMSGFTRFNGRGLVGLGEKLLQVRKSATKYGGSICHSSMISGREVGVTTEDNDATYSYF